MGRPVKTWQITDLAARVRIAEIARVHPVLRQFSNMIWTAYFVDPATDGKTIIPLKDFQLIFPAILGKQKPAWSGFFASANGANMHYEVGHTLLSVGNATCGDFASLLNTTGNGTVMSPSSVPKVRVRTEAQLSQSQ